MVKIVNPMGDVKIGKQGEVVYQRHYGQQTRRMVSPKRAIASATQIAHRQLYRAALDWRKGLSRPNRRYLEGYCIANGVVDSYHIPLPWHRFALKCYLEHVHFVIIEKPTETYEKHSALFEHYDDEGEFAGFFDLYANTWAAQTFTPQQTHDLTKVEFWVKRQGTIGIVTVAIRAVDGSHLPTGPDLVSNTFPGMELTTSMVWKQILLSLSNLLVDVEKAIIVRLAGGNSSNKIRWGIDYSAAAYPRGQGAASTDGGTTWIPQPTVDCSFREYGEYEVGESVPGLIHVRHPALLSVVHYRQALIINEYENLSSLDEEYLTKQVGIDVEAGDIIKATTIAGIEYSYTIH